jgi:hypothetical protein
MRCMENGNVGRQCVDLQSPHRTVVVNGRPRARGWWLVASSLRSAAAAPHRVANGQLLFVVAGGGLPAA